MRQSDSVSWALSEIYRDSKFHNVSYRAYKFPLYAPANIQRKSLFIVEIIFLPSRLCQNYNPINALRNNIFKLDLKSTKYTHIQNYLIFFFLKQTLNHRIKFERFYSKFMKV